MRGRSPSGLADPAIDIIRSSWRPVLFGDTEMGRHLMVAYEEIHADSVYPMPA